MCLFPRIVKNPKYKVNKKNGGRWVLPDDPRTIFLPVGCGNCMECRKKKARDWAVRLKEEIKHNKNGIFVTLTFSNKSIAKLCKSKKVKGLKGYEKDNAIATEAVRKFTERWRKKFKKQPRRWLITELGHEGTENIHLHGFIWTDQPKEIIKKIWGYGWCWIGKELPDGSLQNYVSERTINYCIKYVYKVDLEHKYYKAKVLTSNGIGAAYTKSAAAALNKYKEGKTNEAYRTETGHKLSIPIYYRNKIYSEEEREKLWIEKLNKNVRYINGLEIDISETEDEYYKILKREQKRNARLGYGNGETDWDRKKYEDERRQAMLNKRIKKEIDAAVRDATILEREAPF